MARSLVSDKALSNIQDCVAELKRYFFKENTAIVDGNPHLCELEIALELILLSGLKERYEVSDLKTSYWDYIFACLSSSKKVHQSVELAKSSSKSSIGRGRAFLRICLMQSCLADTLQNCFEDEKTTRDFYLDYCILLQPKLWSSLVTYLYDLEKVTFKFNQHAALGVLWPFLTRKPQKELMYARSSVTQLSMEMQNLINSELEAPAHCFAKTSEVVYDEVNDTLNEKGEIKSFDLISDNIDEISSQDNLGNTKRIYEGNSKNGIEDLCVESDYCAGNRYPKTSQDEEKCTFLSNVTSCNAVKRQIEGYVCSNSGKQANSNMLQNLIISEKIKPELMYGQCKNKICSPGFEKDNFTFISQKNVEKCYNFQNLKFGMFNTSNQLIFEMKLIFEFLSNTMCTYSKDSIILSYITRLNTILNYLEMNYVENFDLLKECDIYKEHSEDFAKHLRLLASKHEAVVDSLSEKMDISIKENESLLVKMNFLQDKLQLYGLLKFQTDSNLNIERSANAKSINLSNDGIDCDVDFCDYASKETVDSLHVLKKTLSKLNILKIQASSLQHSLNSAHRLNDTLISRLQDQEICMKSITKELEEAHNLLSVMRKQHQKLQSAENMIKYDLHEKRKLLTRLKQQLESTHEDCNFVKIKNSKSEAELQNLRQEFSLRNKQASEESGFVDDKGLEDHCTTMNATNDPNPVSIISNTILSNMDNAESKYILKNNRLQMLEEQCRLLCSNLANSSKKRQEIDSRLESWCKAIENSYEVSEPTKLSSLDDVIQDYKSGTDKLISESSVDLESDVGSSMLSSRIGSENSDYLYIPLSSTPKLTDISSSPEVEYLVPSMISSLEGIQSEALLKDTTYRTDYSLNPHKKLEIAENDSLCFSMESFKDVEDYPVHCLNDADSLLHEEHELQKTVTSQMNNSTSMEIKLSKLYKEKKALKEKCRELEEMSVMLSNQLTFQTQQLKITQAAKDQELTALKFQLNSEILKYERAIKDFSANKDDLNDVNSKVNDQEELILALEVALADIQFENENEKEHQWEQLQDIQHALAEREEECTLMSADLEKLKDFKKHCLGEKEAMKKEITSLRSDRKELQKKVIKLLKEKDILWKRNDHLTFIQKIQINDRWIYDNEVSKCVACRSNFSFLLRKHHCRQCGRIFCYSCSNNWLLTASSKKEIRICDECYKQHLEIKNVVRRDSNVQCSEDSDEAENDDLSLNLNRGFNSANYLVTADSIISLPDMQKTNLVLNRHFRSVPELYMANGSNEFSRINSTKDLYATIPSEPIGSDIKGRLLIRTDEKPKDSQFK